MAKVLAKAKGKVTKHADTLTSVVGLGLAALQAYDIDVIKLSSGDPVEVKKTTFAVGLALLGYLTNKSSK